MDERAYFASLVLASHIGVLSKEQVIAEADRRLMEVEKPEYWMIELSADGSSSELEMLINSGDDSVFTAALGTLYKAWVEEAIDDNRFSAGLSTLWKKAGYQSQWYSDLVWIPDEFDLVAQGVFDRKDSVKKVKAFVEKLLGQHTGTQ